MDGNGRWPRTAPPRIAGHRSERSRHARRSNVRAIENRSADALCVFRGKLAERPKLRSLLMALLREYLRKEMPLFKKQYPDALLGGSRTSRWVQNDARMPWKKAGTRAWCCACAELWRARGDCRCHERDSFRSNGHGLEQGY